MTLPRSSAHWKRALGLGAALLVALALGVVACNALSPTQPSAPAVRVADVPASWRVVRQARGHRLHVIYGGVACTSCHGESGFARPAPETCTTCHEQHTPLHEDRGSGLVAPPACVDCHSFTEDLTPSEACMQCHDEPQGLAVGAVGIHAPARPRDERDAPWLLPSARFQ